MHPSVRARTRRRNFIRGNVSAGAIADADGEADAELNSTAAPTHAHTFAKQAFTQYDKDGSGAIDRCFVFRSIFIV